MRRWALAFLVAGGCLARDRLAPGVIDVATGGGAVRITGLALADTGFVTIAASPDSSVAGLPSLLGRWAAAGDTIVFTPRYPPTAGVALWVRIAAPGADLLIRRVELTRPAADSTPPALLAIHPAADSVPENLLRWYLEFSRPMRPGQALRHVRLVDEAGREDPTAFLDLGEELWDPSGRRLTLLFDPGRVKRGIRTNLESGRPLVAGRRYRLRVESGWQDFDGRSLAAAVEKRFRAVAADHRGPEPARWRVTPPAIGSAAPLQVTFEASVDHALGGRLLAVRDQAGRAVAGVGALLPGDGGWSFTPAERWLAGRYRIEVSPELEDAAGNRPGRPFDHEAGAEPGGPPRGPVSLWFSPRPMDAALRGPGGPSTLRDDPNRRVRLGPGGAPMP